MINASTTPEVNTCQKVIKAMLSHEQKERENKLQFQRDEVQIRSEKLVLVDLTQENLPLPDTSRAHRKYDKWTKVEDEKVCVTSRG